MRKRKVYDNKGKVIGYDEAIRIDWEILSIKVTDKMMEDLYYFGFGDIIKICKVLLPLPKYLFEEEIEIYIEDVITEWRNNNERD